MTAPACYVRLPPGARCKCAGEYRDESGNIWCCDVTLHGGDAATCSLDGKVPGTLDPAPAPIKGPVTQTWCHAIPFMQQTVLLTAVRGPDGIAKYHLVKYLLRWFRRCTLVSSLDGCVLTTPFQEGGGSFMGKSIEPHGIAAYPWTRAMDDLVGEYLRSLDEMPHHFQLHFLHAAEIVGYKHPDLEIRAWWHRVYLRLVHDMHLWPETEAQMDQRLGDDRSGWLARNDEATVS